MKRKYIYYKKVENPKEFKLLDFGEEYLCDVGRDITYINVPGYDNVYYKMSSYYFFEHFITIKELRKQKLNNINENLF